MNHEVVPAGGSETESLPAIEWPSQLDVPRLTNPSPSTMEGFVRSGTPFIIENAISEEILADFEPSKLVEAADASPVRVYEDLPPIGPELERYSTGHTTVMPFKEMMKVVGDSSRPRPSYATAIQRSTVKQDDLRIFEDVHPDLKSGDLWIGAPGASIGLHIHRQAWVAGLYGRKDVFFVDWRQTRSLEPVPLIPTWSRTDPKNPDFAQHPKLAEVVPYVGRVHPGEILFIPDMMWHCLWPVDLCVTLHTRWDSAIHAERFDKFDYRDIVLQMPSLFGWKQTAEVVRQVFWHGLLGRPEPVVHAVDGFRVAMGRYIWNALASNPFEKRVDDISLQARLAHSKE